MGPVRKPQENNSNLSHKPKHRCCLVQVSIQRNLRANSSFSNAVSGNLELVKQKLEEDNPFFSPLEGEHQKLKKNVRAAFASIQNEVEAGTVSLEVKPHFRTWFQESSHRLQEISTELANLDLEQDLKGLEIHRNSSSSKSETRIESNLKIWTSVKPKVAQAVESTPKITAALCPHFTSILCIWIKITEANRKLVDWLEDVDKLLWFHDSNFGFKTARKFLLEIAQVFQKLANLLEV